MKINIRYFLNILVCLFFLKGAFTQGLPPGWDYVPTPVTHIISIPLSSNPNINGYPLQPGDYIGVFYVNDSGGLSCGGATVWTGIENTGIIAFGNDSFTPVKDGFANNEPFNYMVFSWNVQKDYEAVVSCNENLFSTCLTFVPNGLSGLDTLDASGFYLIVQASDSMVCSGASVQLNAIPSGETGGYTYQWTSDPSGFSSDIPDPVVIPAATTTYTCQVTIPGSTISACTTVEVVLPPVAYAGDNSSICEGESVMLNGDTINAGMFYWSTAGDGFFSDNSILNPEYFPGSDDISAGLVQLCLTAVGASVCPDSTDCMMLTINSLPDVTLEPFPDFCEGEPAFDLYGGSPPGGIYFVSGIQTDTFNPEIEGVYDVIYQYTDPNGCTNAANGQIIVNPLPQLNCPVDMTVCCDEDPIVLNQAIPPGGIYSGNNVIEGVFYPDCGITGEFFIQYDYTNPETGCSDNCTFLITVVQLPQVICPEDFQVCINDPPFLLTGATPENGFYSGTGVYDNIFDPAIAGLGIHQILYHYTDQNGCYNSCGFNIEVNPLPSVNAGFPQIFIILPNTIVTLDEATAENFTSIYWSTSGTGTFNDPTLVNPQYTLSEEDIEAGTVILSITGTNDCGSSADQIVVEINECQPAIVDAGNDVIICESDYLIIADAIALYYSELLWANNGGDGVFDNPSVLNPTYTPGEADIENGAVTLTLTGYPLEICDTISDNKLLTIQKLPVVEAGENQSICEGELVPLSGAADNYSSLIWETSGDGFFDNPFSLSTVYNPGTDDLIMQEVTLSLNVTPIFPCEEISSDSLSVSITNLPHVYAGEDLTVLKGESVQLNASANNYSALLWETSGDGLFSANAVLNPIYTPGELDIQNGGALLSLTSSPLEPCVVTVSDQLLLTIDTLTSVLIRKKFPEIQVFPNPASTLLTIQMSDLQNDHIIVELIDLKGRCVWNKKYSNTGFDNHEQITVDLSNFKQGIYLLRIGEDQSSFSMKLIISRP
ncbi:MAG TPA: T9SS type A sorting domain-containing protein [Bacteroidales bacterium]|nr:T9SS type A sorting domain-containing protein [Bacteroidales bacterium]